MSVKTAVATVRMMKIFELRNFKRIGGVVGEPFSQVNMAVATGSCRMNACAVAAGVWH